MKTISTKTKCIKKTNIETGTSPPRLADGSHVALHVPCSCSCSIGLARPRLPPVPDTTTDSRRQMTLLPGALPDAHPGLAFHPLPSTPTSLFQNLGERLSRAPEARCFPEWSLPQILERRLGAYTKYQAAPRNLAS